MRTTCATSQLDSPVTQATLLTRTVTVPRGGRALLDVEFDRLYVLVYRYLLHRFFDPELAEELTAQTFYKAATYAGRVRGGAAGLQAWLLRTAGNTANTYYRRTRWRRWLFGGFDRAADLATPSAESATKEPKRPDREQVRVALMALRPKYQNVVVLRYYLEMPFDEIASVLGCRPQAARARLSRAVRELRERLQGESACLSSTHSGYRE